MSMENENAGGSFKQFFNTWLVGQERQLKELASASRDSKEEHSLGPLINKVMKHYENYYRAKSKSAKRDVMTMFSPTWTSSLEKAFHWIAGWRPAMAFHLFYSMSGSFLDSELAELLQGLISGDLPSISSEQFYLIDKLYRRTIEKERDLSEKLAELQGTLADMPVVQLAHIATKMKNCEVANGSDSESVDAALDLNEQGLKQILESADDLRLRTLKGIVGILRPRQAADFLIAAAELHLRVHEWGKQRDIRRGLHYE